MGEANMAFPIINYASNELMKSPVNDIINNLFSGYGQAKQAKYLEPTLAEQLKKAQLENQYYGPNIESQMGLRGAQAGHLGSLTEAQNITNPFLRQRLEQEQSARQFGLDNPLMSKTGAAGQIGALMFLQQHPELMEQMQQQGNPNASQLNIPEGQSYIPPMNYQQPQANQGALSPMQMMQQSIMQSLQGPGQKQYAPSNIGKLHQELHDIESGFYPNSNRSLPIESEQAREELAAPYRERLGGLGKSEHYLYDPKTHEKIGLERPLSKDEQKIESGREFFNEVFPEISKGFKDFIGKDSVNNFLKYANDYGKTAESTRKIDDLLLSQKLVTAGVVNEASTLGAGKTNLTYRNLAASFPKSDLPALIERYGKELKLPTEAFQKADRRFQNVLNNASIAAGARVPATKKVYYHPEKHLKAKEHHENVIPPTENYTSNEIKIVQKILQERKAKKK